RHATLVPATPLGGGRHLRRCDARYKTKWSEHLDVFLVVWSEFPDRLLAAIGNIKEDPNREILPELELLAGTRSGVAISLDRPLPPGGSATANGALNPVSDHEVEPTGIGADDRLPTFDRPVDRAWHESELFEIVTTIGHGWRQRVVFALV